LKDERLPEANALFFRAPIEPVVPFICKPPDIAMIGFGTVAISGTRFPIPVGTNIGIDWKAVC
jgi:hypothetical protein